MAEFRYQHPKKIKSLSIVLPAYNEAENIATTITDAITAAQSVTKRYEIIVVDDGSKDDTATIVENMARTHKAIRLIRNPQNLGYGPTVRNGLAAGTMEWVFFTDADGQFDLGEIQKLIPFTDRFDFIVGNRHKRQDKFYRRMNAKAFNFAVRVFFDIKVKDVDCAFKLMKRSQLHSLDLISESAMINTEILHKARRARMSIKEVKVTHLSRKFGEATGANASVIKKALHEFYVLRWQLLKDPRTLLKINTRIVLLTALVSAVAVTVWAHAHNAILAYGDAEAHLNIAKRVISGLTPGYAQLGGIWLPLPHVLIIPFVADNWLWRSGIGGSIPSILAFVWLAVILYRLAVLITGNFKASYLAPLVVIINPNSLYFAATPMTETLMLSMFATSVYFFVKWLRDEKLTSLIMASIFTALATLSRYDGWALVCAELVLLVIYLLVRRKPYKAIEGIAFLYSFVAFSGIFLWFLWNKFIFGTFTYFSNSVYGSKVQQQYFLKNGYLPTYHNLGKSVIYFLEDIRLVVGLPIIILSLFGMALFIVRCIQTHRKKYIALLILSLTPIAFYVVSLYAGQASLILPAFAKPGAAYVISNVRYGIQILLAVAIFTAYLGSRARKAIPLIIIALLLQTVYFIRTNNVTTYVDGTQGLSSQVLSKGPDAPAVEAYMRSHYDNGLVLMDDYRRPIGLVESGIPMDRFIGSGNKPYWNESFDDPGKYAKWLIVQKSDTDAVWSGINRKDLIDDKFVPVFSKGNLFVYKKHATSNAFVARAGHHLERAGKPYVINGANSYDILALSDSDITNRVKAMKGSGFNTIRTWCFNQQGTLSDQDFGRLDTLMEAARISDMHVICVLGNSYNDYGGPTNFNADTTKDFFTNPGIIQAYEASIKRTIEHKGNNAIALKDDPTLLAWELVNEPRVEDTPNSAIITNWTKVVGEYVLTIDQSHLISPGTEGFTSSYTGQHYNENHGASIEDVCNLEVVSLCSGHLYPKYLSSDGTEKGLDTGAIGAVVHTWRSISDKLDKPFYIGEVGYDLSNSDEQLTTRQTFFNDVQTAVNNEKIDGALLWNVGAKADNDFTLQYGAATSDSILDNWRITQ